MAGRQVGHRPGPRSNSLPSFIRTWSLPETRYWKWGASHHSVPAIGLTSTDQRQPGSRTSRPTVPPFMWSNSTLP